MVASATTEKFFDKQKTKGRPKLILNDAGKELIESLSELLCTDEEIAHTMGVTVETLQTKDNINAFSESKEKGRANGKKALRRIQFDIAKNGNATMAIWLGKQWLGQKEVVAEEDKQEDALKNIVASIDKLADKK